MWGALRQRENQRRLWRAASVALLLAGYELAFMPVHSVIGSPAFLMSLVPCVVAGLLFGARGALLVVLATIWLDRSHAVALGLPAGPQLVASILGKLLLGVGAGVLTDHQGRVRRLNEALAREIDDRVRAQAQVEKTERLQRALVECLGEGVGLFDAQGHVLFANPALAATLQASPSDLLGRKVPELSGASLSDPSRPQSRPRCYDVVLPARDDQGERLLLVTETQLSNSEQADGHVLRVVRDLTERVATEQRQRKLELELERTHALQSLAVLAGGVAHDFNNLLSGVVGNAELAMLRLPSSTPSTIRDCLSEIKTFASEATGLSRQMLAYAGQRGIASSELDVTEEVRQALRLVRATVTARAQLDLNLASTLPRINADRFQFRQVVTNLLLNAAEALGPERGTVTVSTREAWLDSEQLSRLDAPQGAMPGTYVEIAVEDTGGGIDEALRERIFQPYFSTKSQGRGMGLAAASGVARTHNGWLTVDSRPGEGTRFAFWLPAAKGTSARRPSIAPASGVRTQRSGCVLVIDDEPAVRLVTAKLLTELGQRVITAEDGRAGLRLYGKRRGDIDLVLLDLTMPDLSGAQVLNELQRIDPSVDVVVTSGFQPADAVDLRRHPNVLGFLEKPHTLANLEAMLRLREHGFQGSSAIR